MSFALPEHTTGGGAGPTLNPASPLPWGLGGSWGGSATGWFWCRFTQGTWWGRDMHWGRGALRRSPWLCRAWHAAGGTGPGKEDAAAGACMEAKHF